LDGLNRVMKQLELLTVLARHTVEEAWVLSAIRDATKEVERVTLDELTARYAREIRLAANGHEWVPGQIIRESIVGERIEWLAGHCKLLRVQAPQAASQARPDPRRCA
jgi:hypothetical protein